MRTTQDVIQKEIDYKAQSAVINFPDTSTVLVPNKLAKKEYLATAQSQAKRPKMDGTCFNTNNSNNFVVLDSSTDLSKPISILRHSQTPIVARTGNSSEAKSDSEDQGVKELPTRRDSNGNDVVEIQPESPKSETSEIEQEIVDQTDEVGEFYMPCKLYLLTYLI